MDSESDSGTEKVSVKGIGFGIADSRRPGLPVNGLGVDMGPEAELEETGTLWISVTVGR